MQEESNFRENIAATRAAKIAYLRQSKSVDYVVDCHKGKGDDIRVYSAGARPVTEKWWSYGTLQRGELLFHFSPNE